MGYYDLREGIASKTIVDHSHISSPSNPNSTSPSCTGLWCKSSSDRVIVVIWSTILHSGTVRELPSALILWCSVVISTSQSVVNEWVEYINKQQHNRNRDDDLVAGWDSHCTWEIKGQAILAHNHSSLWILGHLWLIVVVIKLSAGNTVCLLQCILYSATRAP